MEEYTRYSASWMWNIHRGGDDHYLYTGTGARDLRNVDSHPEDYGNSLDQLNKIVERIAPDARNALSKKNDHSPRKSSLSDSHFNDSAYETFLGYGGSSDCTNELMSDGCPTHLTGFEGSGWSHPCGGPWHGNTFQNMDHAVNMTKTADTVLETKMPSFKPNRDLISRENMDAKRSASDKSANNIGCLDVFEKCQPISLEEVKEDGQLSSSRRQRANRDEDQEAVSQKQTEGREEEEEEGKQKSHSPGWTSSKQLLEIGKYTEGGATAKNCNDSASPHASGLLTSFGESSMAYDSLGGLSGSNGGGGGCDGGGASGSGCYISPVERTLSDSGDAKGDDDLKLYTCSQCSYRATKKGQLRKHMSVHGVFLCAHCEFSSEHGDSLEAHRRANHPGLCGRKLCKKCRVLYQGDELKEHERQCSGEKQRWPCPTCNKEFKFLSVMKAHTRKWHPSVSSLMGDSNPGEGFPPVADSTTEEVTGGSDFDSEQSLLSKSVPEPEPETSFHCEDCDKVFRTKWMLSNHMVLHSTDAPFFCDTNGCSTTFRSDKELNVHRMKVHELGPKKYPCCHPDCTMQFAKYGHYKRHKLTHIVGDRKFKCDWPNCGKAFSHTDNLKVHYRRHTDEKPYKCQRCESAYRQKSGLKYHLEKVHDEKSTGRPGRKRKNVVGPMEEEPELTRQGMIVSSEHKGDLYQTYSCPVSSIFNGRDEEAFKKKSETSSSSIGVDMMERRSRVLSRDEKAGCTVVMPKVASEQKKKEEVDDDDEEEEEDEEEVEGDLEEMTSVSNGCPPNTSSSSRLGEIGLNDDWVIDEPYESDAKHEAAADELEKHQQQVVDSSSDFRCMTPKMEPLDIDLREELRRLSDVISGEISTNDCDDDTEAAVAMTPADACRPPPVTMSFMGGHQLNIPHQEASECDSYSHNVFSHHPSSSCGPYQSHPGLYHPLEKRMNDNNCPPGPYAGTTYKPYINRPYDQFCFATVGSEQKDLEMSSFSADDEVMLGFSGQLVSSKSRLVTSADAISVQAAPFDAPGHHHTWMPSEQSAAVTWPLSRTPDDTSPASGRSTRSNPSRANSGDIADHYREAHSALLPTCSPSIQLQVSVDESLQHGNSGYMDRSTPGSAPLATSWSHLDQEEEEDGVEEEEDEEEETGQNAGGEGDWLKQESLFENWCHTPFADQHHHHQLTDQVSHHGDSSSSATATLQRNSSAVHLSDYSADSESQWLSGKQHESSASFSSRVYDGMMKGGGASQWPGQDQVKDGPPATYRNHPGDNPFTTSSYKRTNTYGIDTSMDKAANLSTGGARGGGPGEAAYDPGSRDSSFYYRGAPPSSVYFPPAAAPPPAEPLAYRYYGHSDYPLDPSHPSYGQSSATRYGQPSASAGRMWRGGAPPEGTGFHPLLTADARGFSHPSSTPATYAPPTSMVYPMMPPYF